MIVSKYIKSAFFFVIEPFKKGAVHIWTAFASKDITLTIPQRITHAAIGAFECLPGVGHVLLLTYENPFFENKKVTHIPLLLIEPFRKGGGHVWTAFASKDITLTFQKRIAHIAMGAFECLPGIGHLLLFTYENPYFEKKPVKQTAFKPIYYKPELPPPAPIQQRSITDLVKSKLADLQKNEEAAAYLKTAMAIGICVLVATGVFLPLFWRGSQTTVPQGDNAEGQAGDNTFNPITGSGPKLNANLFDQLFPSVDNAAASSIANPASSALTNSTQTLPSLPYAPTDLFLSQPKKPSVSKDHRFIIQSPSGSAEKQQDIAAYVAAQTGRVLSAVEGVNASSSDYGCDLEGLLESAAYDTAPNNLRFFIANIEEGIADGTHPKDSLKPALDAALLVRRRALRLAGISKGSDPVYQTLYDKAHPQPPLMEQARQKAGELTKKAKLLIADFSWNSLFSPSKPPVLQDSQQPLVNSTAPSKLKPTARQESSLPLDNSSTALAVPAQLETSIPFAAQNAMDIPAAGLHIPSKNVSTIIKELFNQKTQPLLAAFSWNERSSPDNTAAQDKTPFSDNPEDLNLAPQETNDPLTCQTQDSLNSSAFSTPAPAQGLPLKRVSKQFPQKPIPSFNWNCLSSNAAQQPKLLLNNKTVNPPKDRFKKADLIAAEECGLPDSAEAEISSDTIFMQYDDETCQLKDGQDSTPGNTPSPSYSLLGLAFSVVINFWLLFSGKKRSSKTSSPINYRSEERYGGPTLVLPKDAPGLRRNHSDSFLASSGSGKNLSLMPLPAAGSSLAPQGLTQSFSTSTPPLPTANTVLPIGAEEAEKEKEPASTNSKADLKEDTPLAPPPPAPPLPAAFKSAVSEASCSTNEYAVNRPSAAARVKGFKLLPRSGSIVNPLGNEPKKLVMPIRAPITDQEYETEKNDWLDFGGQNPLPPQDKFELPAITTKEKKDEKNKKEAKPAIGAIEQIAENIKGNYYKSLLDNTKELLEELNSLVSSLTEEFAKNRKPLQKQIEATELAINEKAKEIENLEAEIAKSTEAKSAEATALKEAAEKERTALEKELEGLDEQYDQWLLKCFKLRESIIAKKNELSLLLFNKKDIRAQIAEFEPYVAKLSELVAKILEKTPMVKLNSATVPEADFKTIEAENIANLIKKYQLAPIQTENAKNTLAIFTKDKIRLNNQRLNYRRGPLVGNSRNKLIELIKDEIPNKKNQIADQEKKPADYADKKEKIESELREKLRIYKPDLNSKQISIEKVIEELEEVVKGLLNNTLELPKFKEIEGAQLRSSGDSKKPTVVEHELQNVKLRKVNPKAKQQHKDFFTFLTDYKVIKAPVIRSNLLKLRQELKDLNKDIKNGLKAEKVLINDEITKIIPEFLLSVPLDERKQLVENKINELAKEENICKAAECYAVDPEPLKKFYKELFPERYKVEFPEFTDVKLRTPKRRNSFDLGSSPSKKPEEPFTPARKRSMSISGIDAFNFAPPLEQVTPPPTEAKKTAKKTVHIPTSPGSGNPGADLAQVTANIHEAKLRPVAIQANGKESDQNPPASPFGVTLKPHNQKAAAPKPGEETQPAAESGLPFDYSKVTKRPRKQQLQPYLMTPSVTASKSSLAESSIFNADDISQLGSGAQRRIFPNEEPDETKNKEGLHKQETVKASSFPILRGTQIAGGIIAASSEESPAAGFPLKPRPLESRQKKEASTASPFPILRRTQTAERLGIAPSEKGASTDVPIKLRPASLQQPAVSTPPSAAEETPMDFRKNLRKVDNKPADFAKEAATPNPPQSVPAEEPKSPVAANGYAVYGSINYDIAQNSTIPTPTSTQQTKNTVARDQQSSVPRRNSRIIIAKTLADGIKSFKERQEAEASESSAKAGNTPNEAVTLTATSNWVESKIQESKEAETVHGFNMNVFNFFMQNRVDPNSPDLSASLSESWLANSLTSSPAALSPANQPGSQPPLNNASITTHESSNEEAMLQRANAGTEEIAAAPLSEEEKAAREKEAEEAIRKQQAEMHQLLVKDAKLRRRSMHAQIYNSPEKIVKPEKPLIVVAKSIAEGLSKVQLRKTIAPKEAVVLKEDSSDDDSDIDDFYEVD